MNIQHAIEWRFNGSSGLPGWAHWAILIAVAVGGIGLAWYFYQNTLRKLPLGQRLILLLLRVGFFLVLLLCLANPTRVERDFHVNQDSPPLAVVVDHSGSMLVPDQRGQTRLSQAVRAWKKVEAEAIHAFPKLSYFTFRESLSPATDFTQAVDASSPGPSTHLYDSLTQLLKEAHTEGYGGIVCLTDGLDTTNQQPEALSRQAVQEHCPLYFVVGHNQQVPQESLLVREMQVPDQVLQQSQFNASILVQAHTGQEHDVPLSLWKDRESIVTTKVHLRAGSNLIPWIVPIQTEAPGLLHLECRLGEGSDQESTSATIRIQDQSHIHIFYYQGMLNWSFRFILTALQRDPSFVVSSLINPALNMTQTLAPTQVSTFTELPENATDYHPFQFVVIADTFANQMSKAQQTALMDYVRDGGGLLLLVSDSLMAQSYSGSVLESMLPVIFESPLKASPPDPSLSEFQRRMLSVEGLQFLDEDQVAQKAVLQSQPDSLKTFALPPGHKKSAVANLFDSADTAGSSHLPQFSSYVRVKGMKAGGEILAVHPEETDSNNSPRVLLATQYFGRGQVTTLLTDALWRWKLSLPSTSHEPEVFWQQLALALARNSLDSKTMKFSQQPFFSALGQNSSLSVEGIFTKTVPIITATSPQGVIKTLTAQNGPSPGTWIFQVTPDEPGKWRLSVQNDLGSQIETLLRVSTISHTDELSGLPPDTDSLRRLAEATGGCLLNEGVPSDWSADRNSTHPTMINEHTQPLWNNWKLLLLGLGCYVTELLCRRRYRLL